MTLVIEIATGRILGQAVTAQLVETSGSVLYLCASGYESAPACTVRLERMP